MADDLAQGGGDAHDGRLLTRITLVMQAIVCVALVVFILRGDWENVFLTAVVIVLMLIPVILRRRYDVFIPPEFQLVAAGLSSGGGTSPCTPRAVSSSASPGSSRSSCSTARTASRTACARSSSASSA